MKNCSTCGEKILPGSLFCDACGATTAQVQVARKLRQSSFTSVVDAKEGLLSAGERLKGKYTYVIEEAVARSGFGATFRAIRQQDEKQVLIKQMLDQSSYDQFKGQLMKSFKREAKFLRRAKHPSLPRGFEYFEKNKSFYMVMEFINGKDLNKAIEDYKKSKGAVEDGLLVYLGMEIADALEIVHLQGYIYRDMKPHNVMLDGISGKVKLIDFGTLYHVSDKEPLLFESEGYTPPEFLNKDVKFTPAGDIYSLGALLFEAATGETPKKGGGDVLKDKVRDERLCQIITKCLATDPLQRYQRARQLRDELAKLTRKGFWPFKNKNAINPIELSVLPKTLFPSNCTFCEFCGFADPNSQIGYCKECRVPLRVGKLELKNEKGEKQKEFFLYSDETTIGSSSQAHFTIGDAAEMKGQHFRIFRKKNGLWLEVVDKNDTSTIVNRRKVLGPVELLDDDTIKVGKMLLKFVVRDAC